MTDTSPLVGMNEQPWTGELWPGPDERRFVEAYVAPGEADMATMMHFMSPEVVARRERIAADRRSNDWPALCQYRDANAAVLASGERTDVVFVGDSITEFWMVADPDFFTGGVVGRGISGQTSPQVLLRFYADVVRLRPRLVHILCGGNDIAGNTGPTVPEDYHANISAMIDIAQANGIAVVLGVLPPAKAFAWVPTVDPVPWVLKLNAWLEQTARDRGVALADYRPALAGADGTIRPDYTRDGVHPVSAGYAAMRPIALEAIGRS